MFLNNNNNKKQNGKKKNKSLFNKKNSSSSSRRGKGRKLSIKTKTPVPQDPVPYQVSSSGTFTEDDIKINSKGLQIAQKQHDNLINNIENENNNNTTMVLGKNDIEFTDETLGSGSSGTVKKAYHPNTDSILAIKVIPLDLNEQIRKKVLQEIRTLFNCDHPNVVGFQGAFYTDGMINIALEFMDGGNLADVLKTVGTIPEPIIAKIAEKLLSAIDYIHRELHIVHRDIKPQNLLLNQNGEVKLCDFGVCGKLESTIGQAMTFTGTVTYMSPERINGDFHSSASDIWSLGLTLLECAVGYYPYNKYNKQLTFFELLTKIQNEKSPSLPDNDQFSNEFCNFIDACLKKNPEERPQAMDLLNHEFIQKYQDDEDVNLTQWICNLLRDTGKL